MKKFTFLAFLGIITFTACKKSEIDLNGDNYPPSGSTASSDFNWIGEAPLSVKNEGVYHHSTNAFTAASNGIQVITSIDENMIGYNLSFPSDAKPGATYSLTMNGETAVNYFKFVDNQQADIFKSTSGKIRVIQNDAGYVTGFFYATVKKVNSDGTTETRTLTEGYFKVKK